MPVCVDCRHWSPGTFKACPDCSGVLKLEPTWARPGADPQLAGLDHQAKWEHRRARDDSGSEASRTEARAAVEALRQRYNALYLRLLPVLEAQEARRSERYATAAAAAGLTSAEHRANVERQHREYVRAYDELEKARGPKGDGITQDEYERRRRALQAGRLVEEARAQGLGDRAYGAIVRREQEELDRAYGDERDAEEQLDRWLTRCLVVAGVLLIALVGLIVAVVVLAAR